MTNGMTTVYHSSTGSMRWATEGVATLVIGCCYTSMGVSLERVCAGYRY